MSYGKRSTSKKDDLRADILRSTYISKSLRNVLRTKIRAPAFLHPAACCLTAATANQDEELAGRAAAAERSVIEQKWP